MQLTLEYPYWYLGLCLILGLVFAGLLYFREREFSEQAPWLRWLMAALRFLTVTLLAFFLLSPVLRSVFREVRKPVVLIAQDASESVGAALPGTKRAEYATQLEQLERDLQKDFDVQFYSFGASVREGLDTAFRDKVSDISGMLRYASDLYSGQNLGAIVLASDGIYNQGVNPIYANNKLNAPVYTIALGDTVPKKDLVLKRVFNNKIAYLGDEFSVLADIAAVNCANTSSTLSIYKVEGSASRLLKQFPVPIGSGDFFRTVEFTLNADKSGVQRYRLVLSRVDGEASIVNNSREIFVEVLDARQKILILAGGPHPDISALKQSLEGNKNYEVETAMIGEFNGNAASFDFVVFVQLPSRTHNLSAILETLNRNRIPRWFVAGLQTDFEQLNRIQNLIAVQADLRSANDVQVKTSSNFNLFLLDDLLRNKLPDYPPLSAPFGEFSAGAQAQTLFFQRIRKIDTNYPLMAFGDPGGIRTGVLVAEGLWRWRLFNYLQDENHDLFDNLVSKIVQYLSVKEDKRKFRVNPSRNIFNENEPIVFDAELYNNSFELINEPDVRLVIANEDNKEFNFTFNKSGRVYALNAGIFPVGNYRYRSTVNIGGEQLKAEGQFSVQPIELELYETTANHSLLKMLSDQSGGEMLSAAQIRGFAENLKASGVAKPVIYDNVRTSPLINLRWIFAVLILLLTAEWFLRRYFGSY